MLKKYLAVVFILSAMMFFSCADEQAFSLTAVGNALDGLKVCIDAGHGGYDGGTQGVESKTPESDINLAIALLLEEELEKSGAVVVMTRRDEYAVASEKAEDMARRAEIIERAEADIVLSVHQNMYIEDRSVRGPQVFYLNSGTEAEKLAYFVQRSLNSMLDIEKPRKALSEDYYILKSGAQPSIIIECGFLSNPQDEALLLDDDHKKEIVRAITAGLTAYIEEAAY